MYRERTDDTSDAINYEMDWLGGHCHSEFDVVTGYLSAKASTEVSGVESCESWLEYISVDAIAVLREDGLCTDDEGNADQASTWPNGGLGWNAARDHAGTRQRVCGPLMSLRNTDDGAYLNLGADYPDPDRFTFIIWGVALEPIENGATICGAGEIYLFEDVVAQVQLGSADDVEIWP